MLCLHCILNREEFTRAFSVAADAVPRAPKSQVLRFIKCDLQFQTMTLTATDGDGLAIRVSLKVPKEKASGSVLLPTAKVLAVLREITAEEIELYASHGKTGSKLVLRCGGSDFDLATEESEEFPPSPNFDAKEFFILQPEACRRMIRRTIFACDGESTRYALGGIYIEADPGEMRMAATDSRRLAVVKSVCSTEGQPKVSTNPVVPQRAMALVEKAIGKDPVQISIEQNQVAFQIGTAIIVSQTIQGRFPDYHKVIPNKCNIEAQGVSAPIHSALKQSILFTSEEARGVDLALESNNLTLTSRANDVGQADIKLPIQLNFGSIGKVRFDARYLADFFRHIDPAATVALKLVDDESPGVLMVEDFQYIVMPLAIT